MTTNDFTSPAELQIAAVAIIASARGAGFVFGFPFFSWFDIPAIIRLPIAVGLSMPAISAILSTGTANVEPISSAVFFFLTVKEIFIGMAIGLVLGVPVYGLQAAGDIVDTMRNALVTNQSDPVAAAPLSDSGRLFGGLALLWMVVSGAFPIALGLFFHSFEFMPVMAEGIPGTAMTSLASVLSEITSYGVRFAIPLMIVSLSIKAGISFSAIGNGVNMSELSPLIEALAYVLLLPLFLAAALAAMTFVFQHGPALPFFAFIPP